MKTVLMAATALSLSALASLGFCPSTAAAVETVTFIRGTYNLAESDLGPAVDTLVVSVSGGNADFVLSGDDNATFSVADNSKPLGGRYNPYYTAVTSSWNTSDYPYLTFWSTGGKGGVTAGTVPGDTGTNLQYLSKHSRDRSGLHGGVHT